MSQTWYWYMLVDFGHRRVSHQSVDRVEHGGFPRGSGLCHYSPVPCSFGLAPLSISWADSGFDLACCASHSHRHIALCQGFRACCAWPCAWTGCVRWYALSTHNMLGALTVPLRWGPAVSTAKHGRLTSCTFFYSNFAGWAGNVGPFFSSSVRSV